MRGPGDGGGLIFLLLLILLFAAILWLAVSATQRRHFHGHSPSSNPSQDHHFDHHSINDNEAMKILDRRFASGEIDEEEYLRRRKLLGGES